MSYARVGGFCEYKNQSDSCNSVTQWPRKTCHVYISIQHHTDFYKFYGKSDTTLDTAPFDKGPIDIKFERNSPKKDYKIFLYVVFSEKNTYSYRHQTFCYSSFISKVQSDLIYFAIDEKEKLMT